MDIKNKVIIVTGASQGIGRAAAIYLSSLGAKVVLAARSLTLIKELEATLPGSFAIVADMREPGDVQHLVDETVKKFGRIDVLINNAGQGLYGPVETINLDNYQSVIDLNVKAPLRAMQAAIPVMRKQGGGMIMNISSLVSKNYFPNLAAYASTKYALNALSLTARQELAKDGIVVSVMHPRMTATEFGKNSLGMKMNVNRPVGMMVDSAEDVAKKIAEQIESEAPESSMP